MSFRPGRNQEYKIASVYMIEEDMMWPESQKERPK